MTTDPSDEVVAGIQVGVASLPSHPRDRPDAPLKPLLRRVVVPPGQNLSVYGLAQRQEVPGSLGTDRKLARLSRAGLAERSTDQLQDDLTIVEEAAEVVKAEVVYGLWMNDSDDLPRPITQKGLVPEERLYALGETPEEALKNGQGMRTRLAARIQEVLDQQTAGAEPAGCLS